MTKISAKIRLIWIKIVKKQNQWIGFLLPTLFVFSLDHGFIGWKPFMQLGAGHGEASYQMAVTKITGWSDLSQSLLYHFSPDEQTQTFFTSVFSQLNNFDLESVYDIIPGEQMPEAWKEISFEGQKKGQNYYLYTHASGKDQSVEPRLDQLGDFESHIRIRPSGEKKNNFQGNLGLKLGLSDTSAAQLLAIAEEMIRIFDQARDPKNLKDLTWAIPLVKNNFGHLNEEDIHTLVLLERSFPTTYEYNKNLFAIQDIVAYETDSGGDFTRLALHLSLNRRELAYKYPQIAAYLDRVHDLVNVRFVLRDEQKRPLVIANYQSSDFSVAWQAILKDGGVLPMTPEGKPADWTPITPTKLTQLHFQIQVDVASNFSGLKIEIPNMIFKGEFNRKNDQILVTTQFQDKPEVRKVSGRAYGVVPSWLIDVFIPSNIDSLIDDFLTVMTQGNDGQGTLSRWQFTEKENSKTVFQMQGDSEILNNTFVKIGFRLFNYRLMPDNAVLEEMTRLLKTNYTAFQKDFARFKEKTSI